MGAQVRVTLPREENFFPPYPKRLSPITAKSPESCLKNRSLNRTPALCAASFNRATQFTGYILPLFAPALPGRQTVRERLALAKAQTMSSSTAVKPVKSDM